MNKTLPDYVQRILAVVGVDDTHVRTDTTSRFRYVISLSKIQIRIHPEYGVILPPKPSRLRLRYATLLTPNAIIEQLRTMHGKFEVAR